MENKLLAKIIKIIRIMLRNWINCYQLYRNKYHNKFKDKTFEVQLMKWWKQILSNLNRNNINNSNNWFNRKNSTCKSNKISKKKKMKKLCNYRNN